MIEVSFRDKMVSLYYDWEKDQYNMTRSNDFWYVMDSISDELTIKWAERAVNCKSNISTAPLDMSEWLSVCNIIHDYKRSDNPKLTPGQKRKCLFQVIRHWHTLEMQHFC